MAVSRGNRTLLSDPNWKDYILAMYTVRSYTHLAIWEPIAIIIILFNVQNSINEYN